MATDFNIPDIVKQLAEKNGVVIPDSELLQRFGRSYSGFREFFGVYVIVDDSQGFWNFAGEVSEVLQNTLQPS